MRVFSSCKNVQNIGKKGGLTCLCWETHQFIQYLRCPPHTAISSLPPTRKFFQIFSQLLRRDKKYFWFQKKKFYFFFKEKNVFSRWKKTCFFSYFQTLSKWRVREVVTMFFDSMSILKNFSSASVFAVTAIGIHRTTVTLLRSEVTPTKGFSKAERKSRR